MGACVLWAWCLLDGHRVPQQHLTPEPRTSCRRLWAAHLAPGMAGYPGSGSGWMPATGHWWDGSTRTPRCEGESAGWHPTAPGWMWEEVSGTDVGGAAGWPSPNSDAAEQRCLFAAYFLISIHRMQGCIQ